MYVYVRWLLRQKYIVSAKTMTGITHVGVLAYAQLRTELFMCVYVIGMSNAVQKSDFRFFQVCQAHLKGTIQMTSNSSPPETAKIFSKTP